MAFCPKCGTQTTGEENYCINCGQALHQQESSTPAQSQSYTQSEQKHQEVMLTNLVKKIKVGAALWFAVALLQSIFGLVNISYGISNFMGIFYIIRGIIMILLAVKNFFTAYNELGYSSEVLAYPTRIVEEFQAKSTGSYVFTLIINLILSGFFSLAATIYAIALRNFVFNNTLIFKDIEKNFREKESNKHI